MGNLNFRIQTRASGFEFLPELKARCADLSPAYQNIIALWAAHNLEKFARGEGAEAIGVDQGANVWWEALLPATSKAKRRHGWPDSIMVATGELRQALSSEELFAQYVTANQAVFGTPLDDEEQKKVGYNWMKRPTIFLDQQDKLAIQREIGNYLNMGADYRDLIAQAEQAVLANANMEAELSAIFANAD